MTGEARVSTSEIVIGTDLPVRASINLVSSETSRTSSKSCSAFFCKKRPADGTNPTTGVRIPKGRKHGRKRLAYSLDEILSHLELFSQDPVVVSQSLPRRRKSELTRRKRSEGELANQTVTSYLPKITAATVRAVIGVTAFAGLRKGEIRGLWWDDDRRELLAICRSVWNSTVKSTKTEEDIDDPGLVPVIRPLRLLLDAIKPEHAAGFVFVNRIGGALDLDNLADRVIKRIFEANGEEWKGLAGVPSRSRDEPQGARR